MQERDKQMNFTSAVTRSNTWKWIESTTGITLTSPWKRIKVQYVSLACGLALATAVIGYAGIQEAGSGERSAAARGGVSETLAKTNPDTHVIYIVGSEAERDRVLTDAAEVTHLLVASGQEAAHVLAIVASPGAEFDEHVVSGMLADANSGLLVNTQVVDLR
jgi:hypothetical protein